MMDSFFLYGLHLKGQPQSVDLFPSNNEQSAYCNFLILIYPVTGYILWCSKFLDFIYVLFSKQITRLHTDTHSFSLLFKSSSWYNSNTFPYSRRPFFLAICSSYQSDSSGLLKNFLSRCAQSRMPFNFLKKICFSC